MTAKILVPAYFYPNPSGDNYWGKLANMANDGQSVTAILNPNSGPSTSVDANYTNAVNTLVAAGGKVVGYVASTYGARDIAEVKADIQAYLTQYPSVTGFFIDEMSNLPEKVAYYQELHDYIKGLSASYTIIGNPGLSTLEVYVATADVLVTFEGSAASYQAFTPDAWTAGYSADHFAHLVYGVTNNTNAIAAAQHAI